MRGQIRLVGIGDDGCLSLTSRAMNAISEAEILAGSERHLAFVPQYTGQKLAMTSPLSGFITQIVELASRQDVCVLASGDPLFFGIGPLLLKAAKQANVDVDIVPSLSSVQLACARYGWPSQQLIMLSVHGRPLSGLVTKLQQADEFALLTDGINTPQVVATHLAKFSETHWQIHVCEALGGVDERCRTFTVAELVAGKAGNVNPLNLMLLRRGDQAPWNGKPGHVRDEEYAKRMPSQGLITKAPIRAIAIANLNLTPDSVMWDIGAASGSVAIESAKQAWRGQIFAIECNSDCFAMLAANRELHKVDNMNIIKHKAPAGLADLPAPDAVFCGGSRGQMSTIFTHVMQVLKTGGRFIVSAVTLDSVTELFSLCRQHQIEPQILMLNSSKTKPLAHYTCYQAENPIHLFIIEKR